MVDDELRDDPKLPPMSFSKEDFEIPETSVGRMDPRIIRDVITIVSQRRRIEREKPDRGDSEILKVVQL